MLGFLIILSVVFTLILLLIPQAVFLLAWIVSKIFHFSLPWWPFAWCSAGLAVLWWAMYAYGHYWGRFRYEVNPLDYRSHLLPASFQDYRIVHISDLHLDGWQGHEHKLEHFVEVINSLQPDAIVFTGDLVSFNYREALPFTNILSLLKARDGVFSILGNHDYDPYEGGITPTERQANLQTLVNLQRDTLQWRLLLNEHAIIRRGTDSIAIIGVENQSCGAHQVIRRGRLDEAMSGTDGLFRILLSHDPSHWRAEVVGQTDIPLTLSGHTHAMQFRIFGFTPSRWVYPDCDGRYDVGPQTLYVNIGLGGTLPMRIGATPEITLITLRR